MVLITKDEAEKIRSRFPSVHIRRTAHKMYMEETGAVISLLNSIRAGRGEAK